jgi:hypothetical protein
MAMALCAPEAMPFTQADIDALKAAMIARGFVRSLTFSDQTLTFDSIDDMLKLLALMEQQVAAGTSRTRYAAYDKGV